jgi:hypothetical protein
MNIGKAITGLAASVALTGALVAPSFAQAGTVPQVSFASATAAGNSSSNAFTYTGSAFTITNNATFQGTYTLAPLGPVNAFPSTLTLSGLQNTGTFTSTTSGGATTYVQPLTGSSSTPNGFLLTYSGANTTVTAANGTLINLTTGEDLLSGTYDGSTLAATIPTGGSTTTASVRETLNGLQYNGGLFFNLAQSAGLTNPGAFSFDLTSVATIGGPATISINTGGTGFNPFTAGGAGTFSAFRPTANVPEPGTYAAFLVGGLGVLGLMVGARKRSMVA